MRLSSKTIGWTIIALLIGGHLLAAVVVTSQTPKRQRQVQDHDYLGGWDNIPSQERLRLADKHLKWGIPASWNDTGRGKTRLLYRDYKQVTGQDYQPRTQEGSPSCVGQSVSAAIDILATTQIMAGAPERAPPARVDASVVYGLSRQEVGELGRAGGGSLNLWACQAVHRYGVVFQQDYPLLGVDLTEPSPKRCVEYGMQGVPDSLEHVAGLHTVKEYIFINSYSQLRDAIYNGCPVVVGSKQGFGRGKKHKRDRDGFLSPPRRILFKSVWRHSMVIIGVVDKDREGVLVLNSWGTTWVKGPQRFDDSPDGSFFVDAAIIDKMLKQGDSYALRGFTGFPKR